MSSRNMYSEHGFDALMRPVFGQVCQRLMVVSYCTPGSAQAQAASATCSRGLRARSVSTTSPVVRACVCHMPPLERRAHELVGDADGVVGVLPADGVVRVAVEVARVARRDERLGLLLLADLPVDEVDDLGVVHVEADHLGGAPRGAARSWSRRPRDRTPRGSS